ncbi:MAG TPA: hypothetical protein VLV16_05865 [Gemmatimonadales bacterium]|nr:hypothetical protein [Gemmatimonadales bacterium]
MSKLPAKRDPAEPTGPEPIPTWKDLAERFRDVMKDFLQEGKELERDLEPRLLPALRRLKSEVEKLIARLEDRSAKR